MNETEVLRIEGNVTVPKELKSELAEGIDRQIKVWDKLGIHWSGNIVPQDSPTGMRLYRVEEVEELRADVKELTEIIEWKNLVDSENDKAFLSLSEELAQEKISRKNQYVMLSEEITKLYYDKQSLLKIISSLELRLKVKDSPIKALLKRIWKWFKSTVNQ